VRDPPIVQRGQCVEHRAHTVRASRKLSGPSRLMREDSGSPSVSS
jgi:hypothetical protein